MSELAQGAALLDAASWVCLVAGGMFCIVGAAGLLRMPDFFTRMHAASVIDTLGAGLMLLGLILQSPHWLVAAKLVALLLLLFFASPTTTHALAKAALARGLRPLHATEGLPRTAGEIAGIDAAQAAADAAHDGSANGRCSESPPSPRVGAS